MKLKSTNKPLHDTPVERVRRVCGRPFTQRDFSHPAMMGFWLIVLFLGILILGVLAMSLVMSMMQVLYGV